MKNIARCLVYLFIATLSSNLIAGNSSRLQQERSVFIAAKKALEKKQFQTYEKHRQQLSDYPLAAYLDYLSLRQKISTTPAKELNHFLNQNQDSFFAKRLRTHWLNTLVKQQKWQRFLNAYAEPQSTRLQCYRLQALINTKQQQLAFAEVPSLWLIGRSQHKACDPVFKKWRQQGLLTQTLLTQRLQLALSANQYSLASYLAKSLPDSKRQQGWVDRWKKIHQNPLSLLKQLPAKNTTNTAKASLVFDNDTSRQIIKHGLERLARKSPSQAHQYWLHLQQHYQFSPQQKQEIQRYIGIRAALNRDQNALRFFGNTTDEPWKVRAALWQQDWDAVKESVLSLSIDKQHTSRWQYWLARSLEALGQNELANEMYQSLISERDYYAFLAADKLKLPYKMNHKPIPFTQAEIDEFKNQIAVKRLYEFYILDMQLEARRQLYHLMQTLSKDELMLLASITHEWKWHNQTIAILGKARYWDALDLRFPVLFEQDMLQASKTTGIDASWLLAIARQESAFNPSARSQVGAKGLMQIMPATGKLIAKLINKPLKHTAELLKPKRNIELGSAYLKHVYDENQQNLILATASYNAGPHRVKNWLPDQKIDADIWIENIPFNETRKYTRNVLAYSAIFDYQRNQPITRLSQTMLNVNPLSKK
jgi:soluble lytic murein transglycosylase